MAGAAAAGAAPPDFPSSIPLYQQAYQNWAGILGSTIPAAVSAGQAGGDGWSAAISILSSCDPHAVFSNPFLDQLLR
jgi:Cholesterol oxidase, substrate-binding